MQPVGRPPGRLTQLRGEQGLMRHGQLQAQHDLPSISRIHHVAVRLISCAELLSPPLQMLLNANTPQATSCELR